MKVFSAALLPAIAGLTLAAASLRAQAVSGAVTDAATGAPVRGAVVSMLDATGRRVALAQVADDGRFRMSAPSAGTYRLRAMRIGYRPTDRGPFELGAAPREENIALRALGQLLDTVRVAGRATCMRDDGTSAFAVWQQAQAAVASVAASQRRSIQTKIIRQLVVYDVGGRVQRREATVISDIARAPWQSPPMDSLVAQGFVLEHGDGSITYRAPDLDALLSDDFARTFCLRLAESPDPTQIGISFAPSSEVSTSSIAGTLWLERRSSALRRLEFRFTGVSPAQRSAGAGGSMEFARLLNGEWMIWRWSMTMPQVQQRQAADAAMQAAQTRRVTDVIAVHVTSGEVALARQSGDTLFAAPLAMLHGVVRDEGGKPIGDAVIALEGEQKRSLKTDSTGVFRFDSLPAGVYSVVARDAASRDFASARVTVTTVDAEVELKGSPQRATKTVAAVMAMPPRNDGTVLLRGAVTDTGGIPVAHAQVVLESKSTLVTDALGRFSARVKPGDYTLRVRRLGFSPGEQKAKVRRDTILQVMLQPAATTLEEVNVHAQTINALARDGFFDRMRDRQRGLNVGYFMSPVDIEARRPMRVTQLLEQFPGIRLKHFHQLGLLPVGASDCMMTVYVDGARTDLTRERGSQTSGGLDLLVAATSVAGVELYPRGMMMPARFQALNGTCGVIAIWTKY